MRLEVSELTLDIKKQRILNGVSLYVNNGELLGLLGPSGCGKSTLLKAIAGILTPSGGRIMMDGRDMADVPPHKRGAVIVFQDMRLFPNMNALDNVAFPLKMRGIPTAKRRAEARRLMESVQLSGLEARRIGELSGGQQQRVTLARALAAKPGLLLLDEPFTALDKELREDMRQLVLRLHGEYKMTTVLVTHDREEAFDMADGVALMREGSVIMQGAPQRVREYTDGGEAAL